MIVILRDTLTVNEPSNALLIILSKEKLASKSNRRSIQTFYPMLSNPTNAYSFIPAKSDSIIRIVSDGESFGICEWIIHPLKEGNQPVLLRVDRRINGKQSVIDGRVEIIPVHIQETEWTLTKSDLILIVPSVVTLLCWIVDLYFKRKSKRKQDDLKLDDLQGSREKLFNP